MTREGDGLALRPEDVASEMGMSPTQIRNLMRLGRFNPPIGYAYRTKGKRYSYVVYRTMLDEYLHKGTEAHGQALTREISELVELVKAQRQENDSLRELLRATTSNMREEV